MNMRKVEDVFMIKSLLLLKLIVNTLTLESHVHFICLKLELIIISIIFWHIVVLP